MPAKYRVGARLSTSAAGSSTLTAALLMMVAISSAGAVCGGTASSAAAADRVTWIQGFRAPGTPPRYNKVGVLKLGPRRAKNVLIFNNGGTLGGSAYIAPLARTLLKRTRRWQVWSVEQRANLLEDQSIFEQAKRGKASPQRVFDYYVGWLADPSISSHLRPVPNSEVAFAKRWGMRVLMGDLRRVVKAAKRRGGRVVMAGHSGGGSITTAYATWDFHGEAGASDLSGLVFDDDGSKRLPVTAAEARSSLATLEEPSSSPWYPAELPPPFGGLLAVGGSTLALIDPNGPSPAQYSGLLPTPFVPPVPATNLAQLGYAIDTATSPFPSNQAHVGHLAASGSPRGWVRAGELTPLKRYARMFAGWGLKNVDGAVWYTPMRTAIDADAVAAGTRNPAQKVLGLRAIHGHGLPKRLRIYAFRAYFRSANDVPRTLARQSHLPRRHLTLVDRHGSYAYNDPASAYPENAFLAHLIQFLKQLARKR